MSELHKTLAAQVQALEGENARFRNALAIIASGDCGDCIKGMVDGRNDDPDLPSYCHCSHGVARGALEREVR